MKRNLLTLLTVVFFTAGCIPQSAVSANTVTLGTLLDEMIRTDGLCSLPAIEYRASQVSSYDRRTVSPTQPGWFANDDGAGYERLDTIGGRVVKVLFDEQGPGAVTRIWMTTRDKRGTLRFYLDGATSPQIEIPAYDMDRFPVAVGEALSLTHTHYETELSGIGGNTFFLPIPYAQSCLITLEEPDITVKIPRYHHIEYRTYPAGTDVRTFSFKELEKLAGKLAEVNRRLLSPETFTGGIQRTRTFTSRADSAASLHLPDGKKAIRTLQVDLSGFDPADYAELTRNLWLCIDFDGVECVRCPLDCFFGAGTGAPAASNRYTSCDGKGAFVSRWVMPYARTAEVRIESRTDRPYTAIVTAYAKGFARTGRTLYYHATYRAQDAIPVSNNYNSPDNLDWNFTTINGRGIYCGDILTLYNHCPNWYGEGDEKIWIDDDTFPSFMGTGTEDYYNCSWAPVVTFVTPFGGAPRADENSSHGFNTFTRTRCLDLIPFSRRLKFDLEMLSWTSGTVDYRTASFWYGSPDSLAATTEH